MKITFREGKTVFVDPPKKTVEPKDAKNKGKGGSKK